MSEETEARPQQERRFYSPWFPLMHQFTFTRNDSWLNSVWIMLWGLFLLTLMTIWGFFIAKPIEAVVMVIMSFVNGLYLYFRLSFKFIVFGLMGFLNSRDATLRELLADALLKAANAMKEEQEQQKQK